VVKIRLVGETSRKGASVSSLSSTQLTKVAVAIRSIVPKNNFRKFRFFIDVKK